MNTNALTLPQFPQIGTKLCQRLLFSSHARKVRLLAKFIGVEYYPISKNAYLYGIEIYMTTHTELLQAPIASLPLSGDLKTLLSSKGYTTLQLLLQQKVSHLRFKDGLTLHDELELFDLVKENGLERMWREE